VIDGGLSTQLEAQGYELSDSLWSARILADEPDAVTAAHAAYLRVGASVVVTASYQVSREGFAAAGRDPLEADEALRASVRVARAAIGDGDALAAASIGPYGAILHDGSEYRGRYGLSRERLIDFHAQRLAVIVQEAPDLLAIETIPDVDEVEAIVTALRDHPGVDAWVTMSCMDGMSTCAGQPVEDAVLAATQAPGVRAVGINCTAPEHVGELLERMAAVTDAALVAYPNAGGAYSPSTGWSNQTGGAAELLGRWVANPQVALVGGCCGVGPEGIAVIAKGLS
jgi:homocysteine S-methyltransferase